MSGEDEYDEEMSDSEVPDSIPATETLNSEIMDQQTDNISENIKKGEDSESESDEESSESEPEIEVDQTKKKTRIIAFVDSDDESNAPQTEEMIPVMNPIEDILQSPQPPSSSISTQPSQNFLRSQSDCFTDFTEPSVSERGNIENSENMKVLFDTQSPKQDFNRSVDDELLDICSGQFALTQSEAPGTSTVIAKGLFNQEDGGPFTQNFNHDVNNELLDLCSGPFSTQLNMQVIY